MSNNAFIDTMRTRTLLDAAMYFINLPLENSSEGYLKLKAQARAWLLAEHTEVKLNSASVFNTVPQPEPAPDLDVDTFPVPATTPAPEVVILLEDSSISVVAATIDNLIVHIIDLDHPNDDDLLRIGTRLLPCDRQLVYVGCNPDRVREYVMNAEPVDVDTYIERGVGNCPRCGSEENCASDLDGEGSTVRQERHCSKCNFDWVDIYRLESYEPLER